MKLILVVLLLVAFAYCQATHLDSFFQENGARLLPDTVLSNDDVEMLFVKFAQIHKKEYKHDAQLRLRFQIFKQNLERVKQMNAGQNVTTYGITKFFDLTPEEFRRYHLARPMERPVDAQVPDVSELSDLPKNFDWRKYNAVTYVKDQGQCGSCWAFSTTGNIEGQWSISKGNTTSSLVPLSEQELVDCDRFCDPTDPTTCDDGCNGGLMNNAFRYIISKGGIATEDTYRYYAVDGKCKDPSKYTIGAKISNWTMLTQNETLLQNWLVQHGPIAVAMNADPLQYYTWGILSGYCDPKELNHGVLIVGYGCDRSWFSKKEFCWWTVKNSWGEGWGESGYFRITLGNGECGINTFACTSFV